jgi:hypothetical protein
MNPSQSKRTQSLNNACLERVTFEGTPYFLYENSLGVFCAVKEIIPSSDGFGRPVFDEDIGELVLGEDLAEIKSSFSVEIEVLRDDFMPYIVDDLRRLTNKFGEEYFSYQTAQGNSEQGLGNFYPTDNPRIARVELVPRFFVRALV